MPDMGCQYRNGYQRHQDHERKLLHTGHIATIEHTNCLPTQPTTPPSPNPPCHHLDSSPHCPFTNRHTKFVSTPQSLSQDSIFMTTHLPAIINPVSPSYFVPYFPVLSKFSRHRTPQLYSIFYPSNVPHPYDKISTHLNRLHARKKDILVSSGLA
jgi:hypothetical protein